MLLAIYSIPAVVLGAVVGRWWTIALSPAGWFLVWSAFVVTGARRGDAFSEIYVGLGVTGAAAAAFGVAVHRAWALA